MLESIARPFGILLMWLYEFTANYGLAVILFALIVKLILLPFMMKSKHGMMRISTLQPRLKELEKKYGGNKLKYQEEMQKLYKEEGVSPTSGCIWSLIPFPILIALYGAIRKPLTTMMGVAESLLAEGGALLTKLTETGFQASASSAYLQIDQARWISNHFSEFEGISDKLKQIDYSFLGLDLGAVPNWKVWQYSSTAEELLPELGLLLIPIVAALLTWLSSRINAKMNPTGAENANSMMLMMPLMTLVFAFMMPAALGVYWAASTLFGIVQDVILTKHYTKVIAAETAESDARRAKREAELEAKRMETERLRAQNATVQNENTSKRRQQAREKAERAEKVADWERRRSGEPEEYEPSREGSRKYARGRAYDPDRFTTSGQVATQADVDKAADETVPAETAAVTAETEHGDTAGEDTGEICEEPFEGGASEDE